MAERSRKRRDRARLEIPAHSRTHEQTTDRTAQGGKKGFQNLRTHVLHAIKPPGKSQNRLNLHKEARLRSAERRLSAVMGAILQPSGQQGARNREPETVRAVRARASLIAVGVNSEGKQVILGLDVTAAEEAQVGWRLRG